MTKKKDPRKTFLVTFQDGFKKEFQAHDIKDAVKQGRDWAENNRLGKKLVLHCELIK